VQNSPARLPDVGLGPRVGLPGRRQPAGYGTSWSVLVSSTSGRSGPSNRIYFTIFHPRTSGRAESVQERERERKREHARVGDARARKGEKEKERVI
jgi:hypothetical protein